MKKTAIIYCRVSTTKQENKWDSIKQQEYECKKYCKEKKISVLWVFKETYTWKVIERPIFNAAIENAIENKINYFVIFDIDRFTREWYWSYSNIKNKLREHNIKLRDTKNIIWEERVVIKNDLYDMSAYKWNFENPTEMSEMVHAAQWKIEWNKIVQRTITKEIRLEQAWYHPRSSNFWFMLEKVKSDKFNFAKIQVKHPLEWNWIEFMFKERAKWQLNDKEIVKQVNLMWCLKRKNIKVKNDIPMDIKYMQELIKKPIYAWIKVAKWNNNQPMIQKYPWLISIDIWNKANRGKKKIIKWKDGSINIIDWKEWEISNLVKRRHKYNPNFPFRNLISNNSKESTLTWSSSTNPKWNKYSFYHSKSSDKSQIERYPKKDFEKNIYGLFENIEISKTLKIMFIDKFNHIFESNKKEVFQYRKKFEIRNIEIENEIQQLKEQAIKTSPNFTIILEAIEEKLSNLKNEKKELIININSFNNENIDNIDKFKEFSLYLLEHFVVLLKQSDNYDEKLLIFKFFFKETPTYNEVVNRTAKLYPFFALNTKKDLSQNEKSSLNLKWQQTVYLVRNSIMDYEGLYRTWIEDRLCSK